MTTTRQMPAALAIGGAVAIGVLTAIQARINGVLGVRLDDGIVAAFISFGVGLTTLAVIVPLIPKARAGVGRLVRGVRASTIPPWMLLGGVCGALNVTTQGLVVGILGVSLFTVGVVAGQTLHGLVLDRIGFGPAGVVAVTPGRVLGGILALAAVGVSLSGDVIADTPLWLLVLPFVAGVALAWQAATNGRLKARADSSIAATLTNIVSGTFVMAIAAAISIAVKGMPAQLPTEPWLYFGGVLGFTYILLGASIVAHTGVLLMGLAAVLGQLTTSITIDLIWPPDAGPAAWQLVAMIVIAAVSVLVAVPRQRGRISAP